jgi:hypothetical protein
VAGSFIEENGIYKANLTMKWTILSEFISIYYNYISSDENYNIHNYSNASIFLIEPTTPYNASLARSFILPECSINKLPRLNSDFVKVDPSNHMPYIKINEFLNSFKELGIYTFIRQGTVEIKTFSDIFNQKETINISDISTIIKDIENQDINGFNLKFSPDSNDEYYKKMLPVSTMDAKYTIKDPVASKILLSANGSETNHVRLVLDENSYYIFNKSFLNADNNWKFLCYNNIDLIEGNGDFKLQSKFSPLIPSGSFNEFDVACKCLTFSPVVNMAMRLCMYYNLYDGLVPFATSYSTAPNGNEIEGSELVIKWDGVKGIRNVLLKEYLEWETNIRKDCKTITQWSAIHLNDFDFSKKYHNRGSNFLVKSVKYSMDFKSGVIKHNETELVRV